MIWPSIRETLESLVGKTNRLAPNKKEGVGFQWFGLRQPDYSKKCSCEGILGTTDSPVCKRCLSTGYLFSDKLVKGYTWMGVLGSEFMAKPGVISTQQRNLIVEYDRPISKFDFILELDQDPDTGTLRQPMKIMRYFKIQDTLPIRGDGSKLEFWKVSIEERNVLDGRPGPSDTGFNYSGNRNTPRPE